MWLSRRSTAPLLVIPKSAPAPLPYKPPSRRSDYTQELRKFIKQLDLEVPEALLNVSPSLIRQLVPRELSSVLRFMEVRKIKDSRIVSALLDRLEELLHNIPLGTLLHTYKLLPSDRTATLVASRLDSNTVKELKRDQLIMLLGVPGINVSTVAHALTSHIHTASLYDMATIINRVRKVKNTPSVDRLITALSNGVEKHLDQIDPSARDLALLANGFAEHGYNYSGLMSAITQKVSRIPPSSFSPVSIALMLHAIAKSGHHDFSLFDIFGGYIVSNLTMFRNEPKAVSMILFAYGKCEVKNDSLLSAFSELIKRDMQVFPSQSLAMSIYGFSKLRFTGDKDLWRLLSNEVVYRGTVRRHSKKFIWTQTDLGMIAKGFSRAPLSDAEKDRVNFVIFQIVKHMTADPTAELLDGLAKLTRERSGSLEFWISKKVPQLLAKCTPTDLYSIVSSVLSLGVKNRPLAQTLVNAADRISSPELRAKLLFKLCKMDVYDENFVRTSSKIISANLPSYSLHELTRIIFALSELSYRDVVMVNRLTQAILHQFRTGGVDLVGTVDLSMLVTALARLRVDDEILYDRVLSALLERCVNNDISERIASNILFSLSTAIGSGDFSDQHSWVPPLADVLLKHLGNAQQVSVEGVRQVQIFDLVLRLKGVHISDPSAVLNNFRNVDTFTTNKPSIEQSSATHREVSKYLNRAGLSHSNEVTMGPFSFDIYLPESRTVVEIDGPHHFFRDSMLRTSSSVVKHRILEHLGYRIEHVPFQEWLQCSSDLKKLAYCASLADRIRGPLPDSM